MGREAKTRLRTCKRCGHTWQRRITSIKYYVCEHCNKKNIRDDVKVCPKCQNAYWNVKKNE